MTNNYFSDRENGNKPRITETISSETWGGIVSLVNSAIAKGAFGFKFPETCQDNNSCTFGTNEHAFSQALKAEIYGLAFPFETNLVVDSISGFYEQREPFAPDTFLTLDFIEFCHRNIAEPIECDYHKFFQHYHLRFDELEGKNTFRKDVNRIFARNGLAYELNENGQIIRLIPPVLRESLLSAIFKTEDLKLDEMLEDSRLKFLSPKLSVRQEALEKLWDCWERLKSTEIPEQAKKRLSTEQLISKVTSEPIDGDLFKCVNEEAKQLTAIGNNFGIRHKEPYQRFIGDSTHVDYLFHRLYATIYLLLPKNKI
jgi:hypothetical protein